MVFSDPWFLLGFLPASFVIYHAAASRLGGSAGIAALVGLSMVFYAYWSVPFLIVLLMQTAVNYAFAVRIERTRVRGLLTAAVVFNLGLLGYFKYWNFFLETVGDATGLQFKLARLVVPLGISFHTFQQIALLVDLKKGAVRLPSYLNYVMFVLFFPQLIAGPIVLHQDIGAQVAAVREGRGKGFAWVGPGLFLLIFGLFKKVCLADNIASYADVAFLPGRTLMMPEAWAGALAFTLQLYFDFSGYSDMAVGIGLLFGFKLPNNFLVPYASVSIIEFWQRWHITMMRFFSNYLYNPLWLDARRRFKGSAFCQAHRGEIQEFLLTMGIPTLITFLLSGLWHGAGWTFILFGLVHGVAMVVNQFWRVARLPRPPRFVAWMLTMVVVVVGAVYFRAADVGEAHYILAQMFWPSWPPAVPGWLAAVLPFNAPIGTFTLFSELHGTVYCLAWLGMLGWLSLTLPALAADPDEIVPSLKKAFATAMMVWLTLAYIQAPRTFLYFAF